MSDALFDRLTPERLAALVPELTIGRPSSPPASPDEPLDVGAAHWVAARGFVELDALDTARAGVLEGAVARLGAEGMPLAALYVFDEVWQLGEAIARRLSKALGATYELVLDLWAFSIPPGSAGWAVHRGVSIMLDRSRPEYLNVWVALSDAGLDRSCMHFVPLDDDDGYRASRLDVVDVGERTVAAPLTRGGALAWNANILHWGGPCAATAAGPRRSLTFTLRRADTAPELGESVIALPRALDGWRRLEAVAGQILLYGDRDPAITPEIQRWAQITAGLGERRRPR